MIAQADPPDAAALETDEVPELLAGDGVAGKGGTVGFPQAVGPLAEGVGVGYWSPNNGKLAGRPVRRREPGPGSGAGRHGFIACYAMVEMMAAAIDRAGTTDPEALNTALSQTTDLPTVLGRITIGPDHRGILPVTALQWQGDKQVTVWPPDQATGTFQAPAAGLVG